MGRDRKRPRDDAKQGQPLVKRLCSDRDRHPDHRFRDVATWPLGGFVGDGCWHEYSSVAGHLPEPLDQREAYSMMYVFALTALGLGIVSGWSLAARFMVRSLAAVFIVLASMVFWVAVAPTTLPGDGFAMIVATFLVALPMAAGLLGGAVFCGLVRRHSKSA